MNSTITRIVLVAALIAMPMPALAQARRAIHSSVPVPGSRVESSRPVPGARRAVQAPVPGARKAIHSANRPGTRPAIHVPGPRR